MAVLRIQAELERDTALPGDVVVNTWCFSDGTGDAVTGGELTDIYDAMNGFYNDLETYLASTLSGNMTTKVYDLEDSEPRVPVGERTDTGVWSPESELQLPAEVAICLSFSGAPTSGANMARRRGRVFLGPWNIGVVENSPGELSGDARPDSAALVLLETAYEALVAAMPSGYVHSVYSPTQRASGSSALLSTHSVATVWIDNAFDTQRRRGAKATTRTVFT